MDDEKPLNQEIVEIVILEKHLLYTKPAQIVNGIININKKRTVVVINARYFDELLKINAYNYSTFFKSINFL